MKNLILVISLTLLSNSLAFTQNNRGEQNQKGQKAQNAFSESNRTPYEVKGKIIDSETGFSLEYATITLYAIRDSSLVTGTISSANGQFSIPVKRSGKYFGRVEFIGYENLEIEEFELGVQEGKREHNIGELKISSSSEVLEGIEIRAEKSEMTFDLDKKVFNVGKDLTSSGGTASEVLDNVPSVAVDIDGNVSLRGSENVRVLIDGKPSNMITNMANLEQLPANMIDKVEVVTNPSAKFEAEGMAGIINIILRKEKRKGWNGTFSYNLGYPLSSGGSLALNYRNSKLNFFINSSANYNTRYGGGELYQSSFGVDTTFILHEFRDMDRKVKSISNRIGLDYFLGKNKTLTGFISLGAGHSNQLSTIEYFDYLNEVSNLVLNTFRTDDELEKETNWGTGISYKQDFEKEGQELNASLNFSKNKETELSDFSETYFDSNELPTGEQELVQRSDNLEKMEDWIFRMDYVHPLKGESKIETGAATTARLINTDFVVEQLDDEIWYKDESVSNIFNYSEVVNALYMSYGAGYGPFSYSLGLRGELSNIIVELAQEDFKDYQNYFNLFPTAHLNYKFEGDNQFQASFSRRIKRPGFWSLNPFYSYSDPRNYFAGNPKLKPEYTNSYELSYLKKLAKTSISTSIYYRYTTGVTERIRTSTEVGITQTQPVNLSTGNAAGAEFTFSTNLGKSVRFDANANCYWFKREGVYLDDNYQSDGFAWEGNANTRIKLPARVDAQMRLRYRSPRNSTQGKRKSMTSIDLGFSREFLTKKLNVTVNVNDLLNSRKRRYSYNTESFVNDGEFRRRTRSISLRLTYRLNQKNERQGAGGRRTGGSNFGGASGGEY